MIGTAFSSSWPLPRLLTPLELSLLLLMCITGSSFRGEEAGKDDSVNRSTLDMPATRLNDSEATLELEGAVELPLLLLLL